MPDRRREPRARRGDAPRAADAVVPQHLALDRVGRRPRAAARRRRGRPSHHPRLGGYRLEAAPGPDGERPRPCSARTRPTRRASTAASRLTPYPKDGINDHVVTRRADGQPGAAPARRPRGGTAAPSPAAAARSCSSASTGLSRPRRAGRRRRPPRRRHGRARPSPRPSSGASAMPTSSTARSRPAGSTRSGCGSCGRRPPGLVWSKQFYPYRRRAVARRRPGAAGSAARPRDGRNAGWRHLDAFDILAMPDPWEYPWFAAWDLAFHAVAWAHLDPAFAKYQLLVLLREWFQHPNGALPAYEWNFDDVNPPVHAIAAAAGLPHRRRARTPTSWSGSSRSCCSTSRGGSTGRTPTATTSSAAASWASTTSAPSTGPRCPPGMRLEQADGTAWMACYALSMLVIARRLAETNPVYEDMVVKFVEQYLHDRRGHRAHGPPRHGGRLVLRPARGSGGRHADPGPDPRRAPSRCCRPRSCGPPTRRPPAGCGTASTGSSPRPSTAAGGSPGTSAGARPADRVLLSVVGTRGAASATLASLFDEAAFLSPHGLRSLSKRHEVPYEIPGHPEARIDYEPAEGRTAMYGGNSNWRGPVWMPLNVLIIPALVRYHRFLGRRAHRRVPHGVRPAADPRRHRPGPWRSAHLHLAPRPGRPAPGVRGRSSSCSPTRVAGTALVPRVLPRRHRCRARGHAPDGLDGRGDQPAPGPAPGLHAGLTGRRARRAGAGLLHVGGCTPRR